MQRFPQCLYRQGGTVEIDGHRLSWCLVNDEAGLQAALVDGWCETVDAAVKVAAAVPVADAREVEGNGAAAVSEESALIARLEKAGKKADKRWSLARLRDEAGKV